MARIHPASITWHAMCNELPRVGAVIGATTATEEGKDTQSLHELARNLEGLSMGVLPLPMREILIHLHRHIVG